MPQKIQIEDLINKTGSLYKLVVMASKRAIELNAGAGKLVEASPFIKPSMLALEEISQGKVKIKEKSA
ncbi:MAG: DNA-directed RNA polymerase subunit omega [Candidatus Omnitrophica bacterium]|nr:DNA-directed RNA polymerase subunit omega [Candidatus Omnitrophota bacterium]